MRLPKPVGNGAAARKYDLLSAMGTMALAGSPAEQRLVLRLMVAITARYNWAADMLAVAQADLARMWSVDERTVKRMMAEYRARGWLRLKRQATRGRVAEYGLGIDDLLRATRADWSRVGPDFEARLSPPAEAPVSEADRTPETDRTVVPFPATPAGAVQGRIWPRMLAVLAASDPATARAWLHGLTEEGIADGVLTLACGGRYQANYLRTHLAPALLVAARRFDPGIEGIAFQVRPDRG